MTKQFNAGQALARTPTKLYFPEDGISIDGILEALNDLEPLGRYSTDTRIAEVHIQVIVGDDGLPESYILEQSNDDGSQVGACTVEQRWLDPYWRPFRFREVGTCIDRGSGNSPYEVVDPNRPMSSLRHDNTHR
jgi:hypothetical protein